jgi:hypothetical protein
MSKKYPRIEGYRRKPHIESEGNTGQGNPCEICGLYTSGQKWYRGSYMRGDDEIVYICSEHWKLSSDEILDAISEQQSHS